MKKIKFISYICTLILLVVILTACKDKENETADTKNVGSEDIQNATPTPVTAIDPDEKVADKPDDVSSWAAIYEKEKESLVFNKDGSAVYQGKKYDSYTIDDTFITLKGPEEIKMRYVMKRTKMLLYETKEYKREALDEYKDVPEGSVVGLWSFDEKYSFEFTEKGSFYEDRNFPGYYLVDEAQKSIKLMYNDHFEDIFIYYNITGDVMFVEYPWSLVPTEK